MRDTPGLGERPCLHFPELLNGAPYLGVYFRYGDIATTYLGEHPFLDPGWLRRFLPAVLGASNVEHTALFENRKVHGSDASKRACEGYFAALASKLRNWTG